MSLRHEVQMSLIPDHLNILIHINQKPFILGDTYLLSRLVHDRQDDKHISGRRRVRQGLEKERHQDLEASTPGRTGEERRTEKVKHHLRPGGCANIPRARRLI